MRLKKKARPLMKATLFPLDNRDLFAFETLKQELATSSLRCTRQIVPSEIETNASTAIL